VIALLVEALKETRAELKELKKFIDTK